MAEELESLLRNDEESPQHQITEFKGIAKDFWKGIDAQEYVNRERASWDNDSSYHSSDETPSESEERY